MNIKKLFARIAVLSAVMLIGTGCGSKADTPEPGNTSDAIEAAPASFQGVVKAVDKENRQITFLNINYSTDIVLGYADASAVYNADGRLTTPETLEAGSIVLVQYKPQTMVAGEISIDKDSWEYDNVVKWTVDTGKHMFSISDTNYRYSDSVVVLSNGEMQNIMCLNPVDKLKVYGTGNRVCSVIVKEGHGYIRPSNYDDFVGGTVSVGYSMNKPVEDNMLLVVREGTYEVTMRNGSLTGTRTIQVDRDRESELDMTGAALGSAGEGMVEFDVWPPGTDVYVNGKLIDAAKMQKLKYGEHSVVAMLTGYTTYKGVLTVNSPNPTVIINLAKEIAEVDDSDKDSDKDSSNGHDNGDSETTVSDTGSDNNVSVSDNESLIKYDKNHTITIKGPQGATVHMNGFYKGIAPCSFTKQIGTQVITLSRAGCASKSYTIVVNDDGQNAEWTFPGLTAGY